MIQAINYTSGRDIILGAAEVRRRLYAQPPKPAKAVEALPTPAPPKRARIRPPRYWELANTQFDSHITAYLMHMGRNDQEANEPSITTIVKSVLERYPRFTIADLRSASRVRGVVAARQEAMYQVRMIRPDLSFPVIGKWFRRDHTTVLHAFNKIKAMREAGA